MDKQNIKEEGVSRNIIEDDEIDLIALIKTIWVGRKTIYYSVGVTVFIGLLVAFLSPAKYEVSTTLLPSSEEQGGGLGNLSELVGMAGINLSGMSGEAGGIPVEIYPQVVSSYPFLKEMIHQKFNFEGYNEPVSVYEYVSADTIESLSQKIAKYTIRLPWTIKDALKGNAIEKEDEIDYGVLNIKPKDLRALGAVQNKIGVEVDSKTGLVMLTVEANEPVLSAQYAQKATELLQDYIVNYKTKQARENLKFIEERCQEKQQEYEESQKAFYDYKDRHRNIVSERVDPQFQLLSDRYQMASTIYKGLAQQLEQAKISVKEETPAFSILEPAKVPFEKSSPRKKVIIAVSIFFGIFIGLSIIFGRLIWSTTKRALK